MEESKHLYILKNTLFRDRYLISDKDYSFYIELRNNKIHFLGKYSSKRQVIFFNEISIIEYFEILSIIEKTGKTLDEMADEFLEKEGRN